MPDHDIKATLTNRLLDGAAIGFFLFVWELAPRLGGLLETFITQPSSVGSTLLFAATVTISVLGLALNGLLGRFEKRVLHWREA